MEDPAEVFILRMPHQVIADRTTQIQALCSRLPVMEAVLETISVKNVGC